MKLTFFGGARSVTGSKFLIEANGEKILLECGLFQGKREATYDKNKNFPFKPSSINVVVLSHAHIDHCGNIPGLCRQGFDGMIFSTHATRDLAGILLQDSAHLQENDINYVNRKRERRGEKPFKVLYTFEDAEKAMRRFVSINYHREFTIGNGVKLKFYDAGHILGSAITELSIKENSRPVKILFTGDIGRKHMPILRDKEIVPGADYIIMETTYGDRNHHSTDNIESRLAEVINNTCKRGGKVIIPSFSVGRTQQVVYFLHELTAKKKIPEVPVFVDSPLSVNATEIFRIHPECYNEDVYRYILSNDNPFGFANCEYIREAEKSKQLNNFKKSCVIISSSGMCEGGRILHHLKNTVTDPKNTVMMVGFCAPETLGRKIVEKAPKIKIFGDEYELNAEIVVENAFSAHADRDELLSYAKSVNSNAKSFFLVHGDEDQSLAFAGHLATAGIRNSVVPREGESYDLN
ncbi:MAG: MBL fold metallo-hydrolase [bacterium]|nr:MBL fold metallo-hydrolase [bacterium]